MNRPYSMGHTPFQFGAWDCYGGLLMRLNRYPADRVCARCATPCGNQRQKKRHDHEAKEAYERGWRAVYSYGIRDGQDSTLLCPHCAAAIETTVRLTGVWPDGVLRR